MIYCPACKMVAPYHLATCPIAGRAIPATTANLCNSTPAPRIGSDYGESTCHNLACGVLTYAAEWCPGCGSQPDNTKNGEPR